MLSALLSTPQLLNERGGDEASAAQRAEERIARARHRSIDMMKDSRSRSNSAEGRGGDKDSSALLLPPDTTDKPSLQQRRASLGLPPTMLINSGSELPSEETVHSMGSTKGHQRNASVAPYTVGGMKGSSTEVETEVALAHMVSHALPRAKRACV
jgi:hypothetical protein